MQDAPLKKNSNNLHRGEEHVCVLCAGSAPEEKGEHTSITCNALVCL